MNTRWANYTRLRVLRTWRWAKTASTQCNLGHAMDRGSVAAQCNDGRCVDAYACCATLRG
eukprot:3673080-Lingulodinium_polyedra.AAC.1